MKQSLYENVQNDIKKRVESGRLVKDEKLPSEDKMCKFYSVSKVTLRKALSNLIDEGYLYAKPRIGYFVSMPDNDCFALHYDAEVACLEPITDTEILDIEILNQRMNALDLRSLSVVTGYFIDDVAAAVEFCTIPIKHMVSGGGSKEELVHYYNRVFSELFSYAAKKELEIEVVNGTEEVCKYLECFKSDPLLKVTVNYFDDYHKQFAQKSSYYLNEYVSLKARMKKNK
ncbi:MAG: GntR family transcriptional regulator [Eubacterium sp.]